MKNIIVLLALIIGFQATAHAQSSTMDTSSKWKDITVGPFFMPGASTEAGTVAIGEKSETALFSWSAGAISFFPITPNFGFQFAVCYDARSVGFYDQANSSNYVDYTFNYFSLRPEFRFGAFLIGLGIGVPIGASSTTSWTGIAPPGAEPSSVGSSGMNLLLEIRVGASDPIYVADNGNTLRFLLDGSYGFTQITNGPLNPNIGVPPTTDKAKNNGPLGTVQLGLAYEFNLSSN